eukprot:Seg2091.3 transcript_id=Seg2091.3/GoldUCD/mRNA.D3Y31 product="hypothetical protein" protein_id=Seg2091.3/GoldUCD/D3Y31
MQLILTSFTELLEDEQFVGNLKVDRRIICYGWKKHSGKKTTKLFHSCTQGNRKSASRHSDFIWRKRKIRKY